MFVKDGLYRVVAKNGHGFLIGTLVKYKGSKNVYYSRHAFELVNRDDDIDWNCGLHTCGGLVPSHNGQWIDEASDVVPLEDLEDLYV